MADPILIVTTSYPSGGKSTLARYLNERHGFAIVEPDSIIEAMYGMKWHEVIESPHGHEKIKIAREVADHAKKLLLRNGLDVVVDATSKTWDSRNRHLNLEYPDGSIDADLFLVYLEADASVLRERNLQRVRLNDPIPYFEKTWEDPLVNFTSSSGKYQLLHYKNNNENDLESLLKDISERIEARKQK